MNIKKGMMQTFLFFNVSVLFGVLWTQAVLADWVIDAEASYVGFTSVKNEVIAENHHFSQLSGDVAADGLVTVEIQLASAETMIPIRNERLQALLFETEKYPLAVIKTRVNAAEIEALPPGTSQTRAVKLEILLHGVTVTQNVNVRVTRLDNARIEVFSPDAVMVNASSFGLAEGINRLREIAGLGTIDVMVPVTFTLGFKRPSMMSFQEEPSKIVFEDQ